MWGLSDFCVWYQWFSSSEEKWSFELPTDSNKLKLSGLHSFYQSINPTNSKKKIHTNRRKCWVSARFVFFTSDNVLGPNILSGSSLFFSSNWGQWSDKKDGSLKVWAYLSRWLAQATLFCPNDFWVCGDNWPFERTTESNKIKLSGFHHFCLFINPTTSKKIQTNIKGCWVFARFVFCISENVLGPNVF